MFSIVIPVYNEEKAVAEAMRRVDAFMRLKGGPWECLIVSDGSTDQTCERFHAAVDQNHYQHFKLIAESENRGKGAVAKKGMLAASGDFILLTDVDLSAPIKEVEKLLKALEAGFDGAIGSRVLRAAGGDVQQSFKRRLAGRIFNFFVRMLVIGDFHDTQCGFKCFKKAAAKKLFGLQRLEGFSFDVEILFLAKKHGLKIKEAPVMWRQGEDSKVRLFRDSFRMLKDLWRLRKIHSCP